MNLSSKDKAFGPLHGRAENATVSRQRANWTTDLMPVFPQIIDKTATLLMSRASLKFTISKFTILKDVYYPCFMGETEAQS